MSALIETFGPYLVMAFAALAAVVTSYFRGRVDGATKAANVALKKDAAAKDELLEMHREADAQELEAARMAEEQARKEAMTWPGR